jgi:pyridoxal phosphate enzyme (YggS family)
MTRLAERINHLRLRLTRACEAAGRDPLGVELLPVSKRHPLSVVREAAELGFGTFGENYVQEGLDAPDLRFVLIGPLQRNKAKAALAHFHEIMTLDRPELAARLRLLAGELDVTRGVWLQVDLWGEATKIGGCDQEGLEAVRQALEGDPRLPIQGFMAIPPPDAPKAFSAMAALRDHCQDRWGQPLRLSMGMSGDLEAAIAAGSDQVRIGTAFFGIR